MSTASSLFISSNTGTISYGSGATSTSSGITTAESNAILQQITISNIGTGSAIYASKTGVSGFQLKTITAGAGINISATDSEINITSDLMSITGGQTTVYAKQLNTNSDLNFLLPGSTNTVNLSMTADGGLAIAATSVSAPTPSKGDNSNNVATTAFVANAMELSITDNITAKGSTFNNATVLDSRVNIVTSISGGNGLILPNFDGVIVRVVNKTSSTLSVYPDAQNSSIDTINAGLPLTVSGNTTVEFIKTSDILWRTV